MVNILRFFILLALLFVSCNKSIQSDDLYGEWKYIKVETPSNPEEDVTPEELAEVAPSIRFTQGNDLVITWGGERLSHGKFRVEGNLIRYKENLGGGKYREFPFLVSKLTAKELVFETMSRDGTRVTALKQ